MSRFIAFAAVAALIAGCSDAPVAPRSVHATGASFDGTPPPPPVTGFGFGSFSAGDGGDGFAAIVEPCFVLTDTHYQFVYTTDAATEPVGMNQVAHIKFDEDLSHQITIHQKLPNDVPQVDAEGIIVGPGFSFRIISSSDVSGFLTPAGFEIFVTGILKTPAGSCETSAQFDGSFPGEG
jgi:hypothetical protein